MKRVVLKIGESFVSATPVMYQCYGVGSCVAVFFACRSTGITAGAHVPLPDEFSSDFYTGVDIVVPKLIRQMLAMGASLHTMVAKYAGGARVIAAGSEIGLLNTTAVRRCIDQYGIHLAASDAGGLMARNVIFFSDSFKMGVLLNGKELNVI